MLYYSAGHSRESADMKRSNRPYLYIYVYIGGSGFEKPALWRTKCPGGGAEIEGEKSGRGGVSLRVKLGRVVEQMSVEIFIFEENTRVHFDLLTFFFPVASHTV